MLIQLSMITSVFQINYECRLGNIITTLLIWFIRSSLVHYKDHIHQHYMTFLIKPLFRDMKF